jgi:hypothetical protein
MTGHFLRKSIVAIAIAFPSLLSAQNEESFNHLTMSFGAGFTGITGDLGGVLDHGGNVQLNGGYSFNQHLGITGNFMFSALGITQATLADFTSPAAKRECTR